MEKGQKIILRSNNNPKRWVNKVRSPGRERGNLTSPSAQDLWIYVTHGAAGAAPSRTRSILGNVWEGSFTSAAETSDSRWVFPKKQPGSRLQKTSPAPRSTLDVTAPQGRSREARSPGQLPALLRPGQLIPATGAGKFLPRTPAARGSVLCHLWGVSTPLLLLLEQQRQNNSHFGLRQSQAGLVFVLCQKD